MNFNYAQEIGFNNQKTNVKKIDGSILETFEMVIANFLIANKVDRPRFF